MLKKVMVMILALVFLLTFSSSVFGQGMGFGGTGEKTDEGKQTEQVPVEQVEKPAEPVTTKAQETVIPRDDFQFAGMDKRGVYFFGGLIVFALLCWIGWCIYVKRSKNRFSYEGVTENVKKKKQ